MLEKFQELKKQKMGENEQINPNTGVSMDYFNKYSFLIQTYKEGGIDGLKKVIMDLKKEGIDTSVPTYSEAYNNYDTFVLDSSKENIKEIDKLSQDLDKMIKNIDHVNEVDFVDICNRLNFLIYGEKNNDRDLEVLELAEAA